ncbi:MAG: 3-keto-5-aminohexanoate cleavage protein, partial [Bradyrhizobium sp.]|uniref:3-keto-5-aminohexanoate cleavage protein n=1 Tax=Bradyrhizobium sp. TaxID=376 RepID=UPI001E0D0F5D
HPATTRGLRAYLDFLPSNVACEWTVTLGGGSILPLAEQVIAQGGHICIGLGDYHFGELGTPTNAELVARLKAIAAEVGREVATPAETKAMLAIA